MALDPQMVVNLRTTVEYKVENEFWAAAANLKYQRIVKILPTDTLIQIFAHRIPSALYEDFGETGGGIRYEDAVIGVQEFRNHFAKAGFQLPEGEFRDYGRKGIQLAAEWGADVGYAGAYWPQRRAVQVLQNGQNSSMITENGNVIKLQCYDGQPLFSLNHPYNFKRPSLGYFSNLAIGAPASTVAWNPGFLPLGGPFVNAAGTWNYSAGADMSRQDGLRNLFKAIAWVRSVKMPDGITPRYLEPTGIIFGPALAEAVSTLTDAQFIAANSTGAGGGAQEIKGMIVRLGLSEPIMFNELIGQPNRNDYNWAFVCEPQIARSQFGAICFGVLEPFNLHMYAATSGSEGINLELAESNMVKWISQGRNMVGPGLPQYIFFNQAP